jgi:DNA topoisomerase-1
VRDADKYARLQAFGKALPKLREQLEEKLAEPRFTREKVLATVVMLLDATLIRVGNTQYARENKSYGLTTLRDRHVDINGSEIQFTFAARAASNTSSR